MKKIVFILPALLLMSIVACNNTTENKTVESNTPTKAQADSLENDVMEGHNTGMAKMSKMSRLQQEAQRLIDSIDKLPARARQAAEPYKDKLRSLSKDLDNAGSAMNTWMEEFKYDSARENIEQRIKYLTDEKLKVGAVKEKILTTLQKADSLIKTKF
jgi:seryl-tRNA synthetase